MFIQKYSRNHLRIEKLQKIASGKRHWLALWFCICLFCLERLIRFFEQIMFFHNPAARPRELKPNHLWRRNDHYFRERSSQCAPFLYITEKFTPVTLHVFQIWLHCIQCWIERFPTSAYFIAIMLTLYLKLFIIWKSSFITNPQKFFSIFLLRLWYESIVILKKFSVVLRGLCQSTSGGSLQMGMRAKDE